MLQWRFGCARKGEGGGVQEGNATGSTGAHPKKRFSSAISNECLPFLGKLTTPATDVPDIHAKTHSDKPRKVRLRAGSVRAKSQNELLLGTCHIAAVKQIKGSRDQATILVDMRHYHRRCFTQVTNRNLRC